MVFPILTSDTSHANVQARCWEQLAMGRILRPKPKFEGWEKKFFTMQGFRNPVPAVFVSGEAGLWEEAHQRGHRYPRQIETRCATRKEYGFSLDGHDYSYCKTRPWKSTNWNSVSLEESLNELCELIRKRRNIHQKIMNLIRGIKLPYIWAIGRKRARHHVVKQH